MVGTAESFTFRPFTSLLPDSSLLAFAASSLAAAVLVFLFADPDLESVQYPLVAF